MQWRSIMTAGALTLSAACGERGPRDGADATIPAGRAGGAVAASSAAPAGSTPIEITGSVGRHEVSVTGSGECKHASSGSIYQRPAALWTARYLGDGDVERLNLAFWREQSGTESVTLSIGVNGETHRIATVEGGERQGSGRASLEGDATAGVLAVEGTSAEGAAVRLRVRCDRFDPLVAEGG